MEDEWADIVCELDELALRTDHIEAMLGADRLKARDATAEVGNKGSDAVGSVG